VNEADGALQLKTYSYQNAEEMINMLKIESGKEVEYKRG